MNLADFLIFQPTLTKLGENCEDGWLDFLFYFLINFTSTQASTLGKQNRYELKCTYGTAVIHQPRYILAIFNLMYTVEAVDTVSIFLPESCEEPCHFKSMLIQNTHILQTGLQMLFHLHENVKLISYSYTLSLFKVNQSLNIWVYMLMTNCPLMLMLLKFVKNLVDKLVL